MSVLKVAILVDDSKIERYKAEIIAEIRNLKQCKIVKIVRREKEEKKPQFGQLLYSLVSWIDAKLFGRDDRYLQIVSLDEPLSETDVEDVDVVVNLGASLVYDEVSAKYGTWQLVWGSYPEGFWEVVESHPVTKVSLQCFSEKFGSGYVLDAHVGRTDLKSMRKNRNLEAWRTHMMLVRNLEHLADLGDNYFKEKEHQFTFSHEREGVFNEMVDARYTYSDEAKREIPGNMEMLFVSLKLLKKYSNYALIRLLSLKRLVRFCFSQGCSKVKDLRIGKLLSMDPWLILYKETVNGEIDTKLSSYRRYYPKSATDFSADPFLVDEGEKTYLFFEELGYPQFKGYLKVAEYDFKKKEFMESKMVLEEPYHLSWPNVFKHEGSYYMVPESSENRTIDLYKADAFPLGWKRVKTLMDDVKAVDTTFLQKNGKWWMFVNIAEKDGFTSDNALFIFYSDDLLEGEWVAHAQNPVCSDISKSRPAGNFIKKEGKLYRPAQDCSGSYGRRVVINEVDVLNEKEYKEHEVSFMDSGFADDLIAVHTLNSSKRLTVIDAMRSQPKEI